VTPAETRYAPTPDGAFVAYQVTGDGGTDLLAVFSHGISVEDQIDGPTCGPFIERLSAFARVIRFDRRGTGLSDPIARIDETTWEHWLDDAVAVLDAAGATTVTVLAADMPAGVVCMLLAASLPHRVGRLVLFNANARFRRDRDYPWGLSPGEQEQFLEAIRDEWLHGAPPAFAFPSLAQDAALAAWWRRARRRGMSPAVAMSVYRTGMASDLRSVLPSIRVPTLVLSRPMAGPDPDTMRHRVAYVVDHVPRARAVELEGADPVTYVGDYEAVAREVEEFVTGSRSSSPVDRALATVMFTDLVGSTQHLSRIGDRAWRHRLDAHDAMIRAQLVAHRGREVKMTGDGVVATFDGPARAISCARAIVDEASALGLTVRAGLHTGEVELRGDDIGGLAVHIGARVAQSAGPAEVLVSRTVVDLVAGSGLRFEDRGEHELRGVDGVWRLFAVAV
jgi:class 3 adenylate cyclase